MVYFVFKKNYIVMLMKNKKIWRFFFNLGIIILVNYYKFGNLLLGILDIF